MVTMTDHRPVPQAKHETWRASHPFIVRKCAITQKRRTEGTGEDKVTYEVAELTLTLTITGAHEGDVRPQALLARLAAYQGEQVYITLDGQALQLTLPEA
jgi:hypothetical protein